MSVHKSSSGRYVVKYRIRRRSQSVTVSRKNLASFGLAVPPTEKSITKRHARALDAEIQRRLLGGVQFSSRARREENLAQAVETYLQHLDVSAQHQRNKQRWLVGADASKPRTMACPGLAQLIGSVPIAEVASDDLAVFRETLGKARYERHTILNALRAVRSFFNWCVATNRRLDNPARAFPLPSAEPVMPKILTPDEVKQLLETAKGLPIERVFRVILGLGLRRQEAQALLWEDVDPEKQVVVIRRRLKTPHARREIPLPRKLYDFLSPPTGTYVLESPNVGILSNGTLETMLARFKRSAQLPFEVSYRICRATYGSFLISKGFGLPEVSRFLGHSSVSLTERWYYGLRPSTYSGRIDKVFSEGYL